MPKRGSVNVHASLLPALRGAAPIQRAILAGLTETGITIMQMDAGMDSGPILHQVATPIAEDETGGELSERLAELGAEALIEALTLMDEAGLEPKPQDPAKATFAPKIKREEERLDWSCPAVAVARKIRAFDPKPGAWTTGRGKELKLFGARAVDGAGEAGAVLRADDELVIACGTRRRVGHGGPARRPRADAGARFRERPGRRGGGSARVIARLPRLHAVTDDRVVGAGRVVERAAAMAAAAGPALAVHVRTRTLEGAALLDLARRVRDAVAPHGSWLVVNDRADVARAALAQAIVTGRSGLGVRDVRRRRAGRARRAVGARRGRRARRRRRGRGFPRGRGGLRDAEPPRRARRRRGPGQGRGHGRTPGHRHRRDDERQRARHH